MTTRKATANAKAGPPPSAKDDKVYGQKTGLALAAVQVEFDLGDGVEALGDEVGVGDFDVELLLEAGDEVGEGEGVEGAGVEEGLVGGGIVGDVGYRVDDFEDACLGAHSFTCFAQFVTACVAFDGGGFISFPVYFVFISFRPGRGSGASRRCRTAGPYPKTARSRVRCSLRR